jgi:hypothetical protein
MTSAGQQPSRSTRSRVTPDSNRMRCRHCPHCNPSGAPTCRNCGTLDLPRTDRIYCDSCKPKPLDQTVGEYRFLRSQGETHRSASLSVGVKPETMKQYIRRWNSRVSA